MTRYECVDARKAEGFAVTAACEVAEVSTSGFYDWVERRDAEPTEREVAEAELVAVMRQIFDDSEGNYGEPRMTRELRKRGRVVNKKRVRRLMRRHGMAGRALRRRVRTTFPGPDPFEIPDLVGRRFDPGEPDVAWGQDITYIATGEGWLYLASVLDLGSRRLLGYSMADHMRTELVLDALDMAVAARGGAVAGVIAHADRGSQGEINRSSQHLSMMEVAGGATTADGGQGASPGDAVAGTTDPDAACGARVLASDRPGQEHRGRRCRYRGVGPRRVSLVSSRWRDAASEPR